VRNFLSVLGDGERGAGESVITRQSEKRVSFLDRLILRLKELGAEIIASIKLGNALGGLRRTLESEKGKPTGDDVRLYE